MPVVFIRPYCKIIRKINKQYEKYLNNTKKTGKQYKININTKKVV